MKIILACITTLCIVFAVSGRLPADPAKAAIHMGHPQLPELPDSCLMEDTVLIPDSCSAEDAALIPDSVAASEAEPELPERKFLMALKTNMLYDALLVPNIGAEFYVGSRLSVYGEWMYAWWDSNSRHRYWRVYGGNIGLRWWPGRKPDGQPMRGHHLGLYGGLLTFDFELGGTGYMGGKPGGTLWDRQLVNAGIEYGYSLAVARHLNIDFSIGLGYMGGRYIKYYPFDNDYYYDKEFKMRYFGPTKAEISLVWLIGGCNLKKRKEVTDEDAMP